MKTTITKLAFALVGLLIVFTSCNKDDVDNTQTINYDNERVSSYVATYTNFPPTERFFAYDDLNRNKEYTYTDIGFTVEKEGNNRTFKDLYLFNNQKLVTEIFTQQSYYNNKTKLTYDNQKRITQITVDEQRTNNIGTPTTNMNLIYTIDFTWNDEHNVISAKLTYSPYYLSTTNTGGVKYIMYTFSGYSKEFTNTMKLANIGLDYFGPFGFPSIINFGNTNLYGPFYIGKQLPATISRQSYSENDTPVNNSSTTNYTYEKDSKGRIVLLTNSDESYRFIYK